MYKSDAKVVQVVTRRIRSHLLSTTAPAAASGADGATSATVERELAKKKSAYNQQLSELRKQWAAEHQAKLDEENRKRKEARRLVVLQKAVRLRARNVVSAQNIQKDRERKAAAMARYREHITKNNMIAEKRMETDRAGEMAALVSDLEEEKKCWITSHEEADARINESLFEAPATTGLATMTSEYWRHMAVPFNLSVLFNAPFQARYGPTDASPEARYAEAMSTKRLEVREMMNTMIGSGADRQHYKEIVDHFVELYAENDALLESSDYLDDEEEFVAEMKEESGIDSEGEGEGEGEGDASEEERLFAYIEKEIEESSAYGAPGAPRYKAGGAQRALDAAAAEEEGEDEEDDLLDEVPEVAEDDDDDDDGDEDEGAADAVVSARTPARPPPRRAPMPPPSKQSQQHQARRVPTQSSTTGDEDGEEKTLDMSIFDTAEETMSRELGEDVAGAAAAAAKKASTKAMQQQQQAGKGGKAGKAKKGKK